MSRIKAVDIVDVFVYTAVLGLFVQFFPAVIAESFVLTLLTAVLLKLTLEVVVAAKRWVFTRIRLADTRGRKLANAALLVVVLPGSKFLVLELTALVFGGAVQLGGFLQVTALIVALMLARSTARRFLVRDTDPSAAAPGAGTGSRND